MSRPGQLAHCAVLAVGISACRSPDKTTEPAIRPAPSAAHRPASITVEAPSLAGADRLLRAEEPKIRACLSSAVTAEPRGTLAFSIGLDAAGIVASVGVTRTGTISPLVASCVKAVLVDVTFDAPEGGPTTINGRFVFAPEAFPK